MQSINDDNANEPWGQSVLNIMQSDASSSIDM